MVRMKYTIRVVLSILVLAFGAAIATTSASVDVPQGHSALLNASLIQPTTAALPEKGIVKQSVPNGTVAMFNCGVPPFPPCCYPCCPKDSNNQCPEGLPPGTPTLKAILAEKMSPLL